MNWKRWLVKGEIQKVEVTAKSLSDIEGLINRDLKDSQLKALSSDRRFATAYSAALNLARPVVPKKIVLVTETKALAHDFSFLIKLQANNL